MAIKDLFANPVIIHADHITGPAKLSCYLVGFYTIDLTTLKDRRVWRSVLAVCYAQSYVGSEDGADRALRCADGKMSKTYSHTVR